LITIFYYLLVGSSLILALVSIVLLVEIVAALFPKEFDPLCSKHHAFTWTILVPAHNEALGIQRTLHALLLQVDAPESITVIAHNCDDSTGLIAKSLGVNVLTVNRPHERGKGFALAAGVRFLLASPPDVVVIIDADCKVTKGHLKDLAYSSFSKGQPSQATYLMNAHQPASVAVKISEFAWLVKNTVRPKGLLRLRLPCQLMGSGMAIPWNILSKAPLASGDIVEDLSLGIFCAKFGKAPRFFPITEISSEFPQSKTARAIQRSRWETGHVQTILKLCPNLIVSSIKNRSVDTLAMAIDLLIPPLALHCSLIFVCLLTSVVVFLYSGFVFPVIASFASISFLLLAVFIAWLQVGKGKVGIFDLLYIPLYVLKKLPSYFSAFAMKSYAWVRTKRDGEK
jgi:cellulose synthase/poly-beta-1,6-N-acetylglucosamine synthase-like glycosyltransferase